MKRLVLLPLVTVVAITFLFCSKGGEEKAAKTQAPEEIKVETVEPFYYVGLKHVGPYTDHNQVIQDFISAAEDQNLTMSGPLMGIYFNSPEMVEPEKLEWMIAMEINDSMEVQKPLTVGEWTYGKVLAYTYRGPYEKVGTAYEKFGPYMQQNGYQPAGPSMERFMDPHPMQAPPESLRTEIWFPVMKKTGEM